MESSSNRGLPEHGSVPAILDPSDPVAARAVRQIRPGYIIRDENFDRLRAKADAFTGTAYNKALIAAAARSITSITPTEKLLLLEAVDMQDRATLTSPEAGIIWARNRVFAERLGISLDAVKAARRGLEQKGIAIRHPAIDNNATRFDIRPFLGDLDQYLDNRYGIDARRRAADEMGDRSEFLDKENHPQGENLPSHIQSPSSNEVESVLTTESAWTADRSIQAPQTATHHPDSPLTSLPGTAAPTGKTWANHKRNRIGTTVICSAGRASVSTSGQSATYVPAESARGALLATWDASPRWQALVSRGTVEKLVYDDLFASAWALVQTHFPERERNHEKTWEWAVAKHHWRAIVMAVVSLEDPSVKHPHKYFGWLSTKAKGVDLADNLDYAARHRADLARRVTAELDGDEVADDPAEHASADTEPGGTSEAPDSSAPIDREILPSGETRAPAGAGAAVSSPGGSTAPIPDRSAQPTADQWDRFRAELKRNSQVPAWRYWLDPLKFVSFADGKLTLEAPSKMAAEWAENQSSQTILAAARRCGWPVNLLTVRWSSS